MAVWRAFSTVSSAALQNLAWAFGYNLIVLPLAAGLLLPSFGLLLTPPLAALLMALSSITVVGNALLLQDGAHQQEEDVRARLKLFHSPNPRSFCLRFEQVAFKTGELPIPAATRSRIVPWVLN